MYDYFKLYIAKTEHNACDNSHPQILKDLNKHVIPKVATRWYDLGLELLEAKYVRNLVIIQANNRDDVSKCCRQMFMKWLDTQTDASWSQLIQAVKSIELNDVAASIEQFIQGKISSRSKLYDI